MGYKTEVLASILGSFDGMAPWKPRNRKIVQGGKFARGVEVYMYCGS